MRLQARCPLATWQALHGLLPPRRYAKVNATHDDYRNGILIGKRRRHGECGPRDLEGARFGLQCRLANYRSNDRPRVRRW